MALRWYVVHAYSNFEHKVKKSLEERIELDGMQDKFGKILVPTEEVVEMKNGQKRRSERKFYPGYVLVQMDMDEQTWHLVKSVPKVLGFIGGTSDKPAPISEKEAEGIVQRVQEGVDKPRPKVLFEPGELVRVGMGVKGFTKFHDVDAMLAQRRSYRWAGVSLASRDLQFDKSLNFLGHDSNPRLGANALRLPACFRSDVPANRPRPCISRLRLSRPGQNPTPPGWSVRVSAQQPADDSFHN